MTDGSDSAKTCKFIKVRPNLGIDEQANNIAVTMVPNPTTGMVKVTANDVTGKVVINITNMIGEEVKQISEDVS
ncbi:hypothetical protein ACE4ZV_26300, partial [Salmonella enterica]|uniref:hypothetical protein n=1 Tax=Salmonella enterica TaxID=28901 RepID=UPI003D2DAE1B